MSKEEIRRINTLRWLTATRTVGAEPPVYLCEKCGEDKPCWCEATCKLTDVNVKP